MKTLTPRLLAALQRVWTYARSTKSDFAREYADEIAQAASAGYITTQVAPGPYDPDFDVFGRLWKITPAGLTVLWVNSDLIAEEEVANFLEGDNEEGGQ